jgi:hypothetical protein
MTAPQGNDYFSFLMKNFMTNPGAMQNLFGLSQQMNPFGNSFGNSIFPNMPSGNGSNIIQPNVVQGGKDNTMNYLATAAKIAAMFI